ncbi:MAG: cell division protein SepF [Acidimicrobiia bacterium]|nr:cell division protein SepF [Acidimicrobiia bacterium]
MASIWQKTLFYLGLVDDEAGETPAEAPTAPSAGAAPQQAQVRTVESAPPQTFQPQRSGGVVAGRRIEPPAGARRRISSEPQHAEAGVIVRPGSAASGVTSGGRGDESEIIVARTFSDAQLLADHIKSNRPVVLDLRNAETAMVRRLVDFASGLTYGLGGKMVKTAQGVILVTPSGVTIGIEERRRLAALDLYAPSAES